MRWIAMADRMGFDIGAIDVHFVPGTQSIASLKERVRAEAETLGGFSLIVADTSATFFEGTTRTTTSRWAPTLECYRGLTTMPGGPTSLSSRIPPRMPAPTISSHGAAARSSLRWTAI